jgi:apolipoprotein D and lipocalin family protein
MNTSLLHNRFRRGFLAGTLLLLVACTSTSVPAGIQAVSNFDLQRYLGRWFEIARLDHRFEKGMSDVSATYALQPNGSVSVTNRGYLAEQSKWREAIGKAVLTGSPTTASLKVSFFGPFYGGYHVVALDPEYQWALVIGPDLSYCWILARSKQVSAAQRANILEKARAFGVNTDALIWVTQTRQDPAH